MPFDKGKPTPPTRIRYSGVWDMDAVYKTIAHWFRMRKYKFYEQKVEEREPSPFGREILYWWQGVQEYDDYQQTVINLYIHTYDVHDVEVVQNGKKRTFSKGRIWVDLKLVVNFDYDGRWNKSSFYSHMFNFYNRYVFRKRWMRAFSPKNRTEMYKLQNVIQNALQLHSREFEHIQVAGNHAMRA